MNHGTHFSKIALAPKYTFIFLNKQIAFFRKAFYFSGTATIVSDSALVKNRWFVLVCVSQSPFTFRLSSYNWLNTGTETSVLAAICGFRAYSSYAHWYLLFCSSSNHLFTIPVSKYKDMIPTTKLWRPYRKMGFRLIGQKTVILFIHISIINITTPCINEQEYMVHNYPSSHWRIWNLNGK